MGVAGVCSGFMRVILGEGGVTGFRRWWVDCFTGGLSSDEMSVKKEGPG